MFLVVNVAAQQKSLRMMVWQWSWLFVSALVWQWSGLFVSGVSGRFVTCVVWLRGLRGCQVSSQPVLQGCSVTDASCVVTPYILSRNQQGLAGTRRQAWRRPALHQCTRNAHQPSNTAVCHMSDAHE